MSDEKPANTVKVTLPTGKVAWTDIPLGPFKYAAVDGKVLENKDGRWVDSDGNEYTITIPPSDQAAHRP